MRIEYWGRIRKTKSGSYYLTLPVAEAYKLSKTFANDIGDALVGAEVKVEVTL